MNLKGDELHKISTHLEESLTKDDPLSLALDVVSQFIKLPDLGGALGSFGNMLPSNLTQIGADGVASLLNPAALKEKLDQGFEQAKGLLESQIKEKLNSLTSIAEQTVETASQQAESFISSGLSLANLNLDYLTKTAEQFFKSTNITGPDLTSVSNVQSAATSAINNIIDNLSLKDIRDLSDPAFYQQIVDKSLEAAKQALSSNAISNAVQQIAPSSSIGSMVKLAQVGSGSFNSGNSGPVETLAEISVYYGKGDGADADAAQKKSVSGKALQSGKSCGVDNSTILIGSTIQTSLGTFTAVDKTKKASSDGTPVVDLYFESVEEAVQKQLQLSKSKKTRQIVKVTPPGGGNYKKTSIQKRGTDYDLY